VLTRAWAMPEPRRSVADMLSVKGGISGFDSRRHHQAARPFCGRATGANHDCAGEQGRTGAGRAVTAAVGDLSARDSESLFGKR